MLLHKIKKIFFLIIISQASQLYCMGGTYAGTFPLHYAVQQGDCNRVRQLLAAGADVNQRDNADFTLRFLATQEWCRYGFGALKEQDESYNIIMNLLIENGACAASERI
jgi:hypothetical protein